MVKYVIDCGKKMKNKTFKRLTFVTVAAVFTLAFMFSPWNNHKALAAFPTTSVQENCNRTENPLSNGGFWSGLPLSGEATLKATGSNCVASTSSYNSSTTAANYGPDQEAYCDAIALEASPGETVSFYLRVSNPTNTTRTGYEVEFDTNTGNNVLIERMDGSSAFTTLNSTAHTLVAGESYGGSIVGNQITAYYKPSGGSWTSLVTYNISSDTTKYTAAGKIAWETHNTTSALDNFGGGTVSSNAAPVAPTLISPASGATGVSVLPSLQLRTTDADSDYLRYKIDLCSDSLCNSVISTFDQTSSQTGWSGQDQQTSTAYTGSSTLTGSTIATYTAQSALSLNTIYYWRAYAIDPGGTNTFSAASSIQSFTTLTTSTNVNINGGTTIQGGTIIQ